MSSKFIKKLSLLLIVFFTVVFFSSCAPTAPTLPAGYTKESSTKPPYYGFYIYNQFPDINYSDLHQNYFIYNDQLYYIRNNGSFDSISNYSVHRDDDSKCIGSFAISPKINLTESIQVNSIFFNEHYLFYFVIRHIFLVDITGIAQTAEVFSDYEKYEYYRFDLQTADNSSINSSLFINNYNTVKAQLD